MWFLRLPWVARGLILVLAQAGVCVARAQPSLSELDVTFFPGVTPEYEVALRYSELRRFLEKREVEEEEEVVVRLLQEERDSYLDEPIEFATQKRLLKQLWQRPGHATQSTPTIQHQDHSGSTDEVYGLEVLDVTESPVEGNFYDLITPVDKLLFQPEKHRYSKPFLGRDEPTNGGLVSTSSRDKIQELEEAFRHPTFRAIPDATISRLLDMPKISSNSQKVKSDFPHHHKYSGHSNFNKVRHHVTSPSQGDPTLSQTPHHQYTTQDHQLGGDHQALLNYLLENQDLITREDLRFILESEKYQVSDGAHTASLDDYHTDGPTTATFSHTVQKDEDWEEDYEYDV